MARVLCAVLPFFRTERLLRSRAALQGPESQALAIFEHRGNTSLVVDADPAALRHGIHPGMTLAQARALLPSLAAHPLDDRADAQALEGVAAYAYAFTPCVWLLRPHTLFLDLAGCERLHGGEEKLLRTLRTGLARLGYVSSIAIADHASAARLLAATSAHGETIAQPGRTGEALQDAPLAALRVEAGVLRRLEALGLTTVGGLFELPQESLPSRFGEELVLCLQRLRGEAAEDFEIWKPVEVVRERLDFVAPTASRNALQFALRRAATFLSERLQASVSGARRLEVRFLAAEGPPLEFALDTSRPSAEAGGLATLLCTRFETLDTGERWFDALELSAPSREHLSATQHGLFDDDARRGGAGLHDLLDELVGRLGVDAVARAEATGHPDPVRSFCYRPFTVEPSEPLPAADGRPARVGFSRYVHVPATLEALPAAWEFREDLPLHPIGDVERVTVGAARDYLLLEDAQGRRHWCWLVPGGWWVPRELAGYGDELRALAACGKSLEELSQRAVSPYAELGCVSNFSFLCGASHPEDLVETAVALGLEALGIADRHTLAGVVRAHVAAKERGLKLLVGTRIALQDGLELCLYAMTRAGYGNLCRLLTLGKRRAAKGDCRLFLADLPGFSGDIQVLALRPDEAGESVLRQLAEIYPERFTLAVSRHYRPEDARRLGEAAALGTKLGLPLAAINDVHFHVAANKPLQDVQTATRLGTSVSEGVRHLLPNAEFRLKSPAEMAVLFGEHPEWVACAAAIAGSCTFSMDELRYEYPDEIVPSGMTMQEFLVRETWAGAQRRYPAGIPAEVSKQLEHELALIAELGFAAYFLTVYDIVRYAREIDVLCQGRGSAANSAVCYCLGITAVDPARHALLFERFMSRERNEPPDIDVDFEHERREEVLQYIYEKYGRERAGICATVITYRYRSAVRDVGKAMGLSLDQVDRLAKARAWWDGQEAMEEVVRNAGLDPDDETVQQTLALTSALRGFPRHLSQHVGGFVITRGRLDELVPIENAAMEGRTFIEWNKDDIDALGVLKVDCLSLGMLTAVRKCFDLVKGAGGGPIDIDGVFASDPDGLGVTPQAKAVYGMLQRADAIGTFQVESRAQMAMLPRLKPARFYDLVVEVAIVRPGPIQGGMVHPYLRRRNGEEPVEYPHPCLIPVLEKTLGVPLFQEQAMRVAVEAAGFRPGEADELRKAMGGWRRPGLIDRYRKKLIDGMRERGITEEYAQRIYQQIAGFGEYGFPESHAASFALITYVSAYLKRFFPAALTAALVNSQPMGFYSMSSLVRDAREHGVEVRPPCIQRSNWDCTLEGDGVYLAAPLEAEPSAWGGKGPALRLGLRLVRGLPAEVGRAVETNRQKNSLYGSIPDLVHRLEAAGLPRRALQEALVKLAEADALHSLGVDRRQALWEISRLKAPAPGMFRDLAPPEDGVDLPRQSDWEAVREDYASQGLSLRAHPLEFLRPQLATEGVISAAEARLAEDGALVEVAGIVINRQRPGTASGIVFMTLEDETDVANLVIRPQVMDEFRKEALGSNLIAVKGVIERDGDVVHLLVRAMRSLADRLGKLSTRSRDFH